jgi:HK97 family phage portal protein
MFARKKREEIRNDAGNLNWDQFAALFAMPTWSGAEVTPESAARAIPVQACCTLISGGITSMPLRIMKREIQGGTWLQTPADDHPYWWLFNESPDGEISAAQFWRRIVTHKLLYGESFARMNRAAGGRSIDIQEVVFLPNRQVQTLRTWDAAKRRAVIVGYRVSDNGSSYGVLPEDMLHFRGSQAIDAFAQQGMLGASVQVMQPPRSAILEATRQAIGIVLAIEEYCGRFFTNGGMPKTVLSYPQGVKLDSKQQDELREAWIRQYGGVSNTQLPLVLQQGASATKLTFTAEEAQMLEARKFQVIDIARGFGVPPFMIGDTEKTTTWGSGIEQMSGAFIRYTLSPHITEIEQEINRKLYKIARYCVDFDEEALARGDMKSLGEWFRQAVGGSQGPGFMLINEVRSRMNLPPVAGGDELYDPTKGASNAEPAKTTPSASDSE